MRLSSFGSKRGWMRSLVDLVLIVTGVLIALAANSWWEARQDRERESAYLRQLLSDTRENEERIRGVIVFDSTRLAGSERFLEAVREAGDGDRDLSLEIGARVFVPLTGTSTALIQTGDLRLVRNDSLRFVLLTFADGLPRIEQVLQQIMPEIFRAVQLLQQDSPSDEDLKIAAETQRFVGISRLEMLRPLESVVRSMRCLLEAEFDPVESVHVEPGSANVRFGDSTDLHARVRFSSGLVLDRCRISWASDNETVASVNDGVVTGIATGTATVSATFEGVSGSARVSVDP
jgi:hypothetical protein